MYKINIWDKISFILVSIGALNWGLIGLLRFNLVKFASFGSSFVETILYILVFAAGIELVTVVLRSKFLNR
ncbi:hypothetical protein SAMN02745163_03644 [Clostridium cavendishii DSM 21758]|uniref:DUF378 domain-containing protein n=1 Tax=Clostridium cavendishii DSM 21758 TaxID=1121302 RepID=A0A1M6RQB5_9CLOT|nr:DUF378 domain-containing protein [Clostridium cavendishii]SHK34682.1 hypothetical protein SAMN02745163_03644 [Clostridium cavendishii DSM 21758]